MELENKTALITGAGAIGGIGHAAARRMAREGAEVVLTGRDAGRGEQVVADIIDDQGKARFIVANLLDLDSVRDLAAAAGDVDILVNNAADFPNGPTPEQTPESYDSAFATNVRAPYFLTAALAPGMLARGGGNIVNVTTMAASIGMPGLSIYGATKAALESLTRTWAAEFADGGVRVNTIAPGPTLSSKIVNLLGDSAGEMGATTPLRRSATTEEIAEVILFLASGRASYMTGATVAVDGGRTAV